MYDTQRTFTACGVVPEASFYHSPTTMVRKHSGNMPDLECFRNVRIIRGLLKIIWPTAFIFLKGTYFLWHSLGVVLDSVASYFEASSYISTTTTI